MKIATIFLKYDYGIRVRGKSGEKSIFFPVFQKLSAEVVPFWIEENGYPHHIDELQEKVILFAEKENPDIIFFVLMNDEIAIETIEKLSKKYITINWFADDQWRFETFTRFVAPKLTYSITMDKYSIPKFKKLGCKVIHSQWATCEYIENLDFWNVRYKYDISFIGGKNITREWYIYELKKAGYSVECFGVNWENGKVSIKEMKEIIFTSKINLNLSNSIPIDVRFYKYLFRNLFTPGKSGIIKYLKKIKYILQILMTPRKKTKGVEQIKARNFEICGFGGFQLSQYAPEIEDYYYLGKEIAVFSNIDELKLNLDYYLNNETIRADVRNAGYMRTKEYTYEKRISKILEEVQIEEGMSICK